MTFFERVNPTYPWLTRGSIQLLQQLIKPTDVGVEFGSGRSTPWLAERLNHLTSFESSPEWHERVKKLLATNEVLDRVHLQLVQDEKEYVAQVDSFSDESIDFCLVDGPARDHCALRMVPKLKVGAVLAIDNINWFIPNDSSRSPNTRRTEDGPSSEIWVEFLNQTSDWRRVWTSNGVTDTALFFVR